MNKIYYILLSSIFFLTDILPQEDNYWNIQYGTRSTLLGGTVIGSVSDLSATYYNPGAIALFSDINFIISTQAYQYERYKIKDGAGEGRDLDYSSLTPSAGFAAFNINFNFLKNDRLVISILTRQKNNIEFKTRLIDSIEVVEPSPGKEDFAGGIDYFQDLSDVWAGITYSTKLSEIVGLGVTSYVAVKNYTKQKLIILEALKNDGELASFTEVFNYTYNNWRTLLKAGLGVNLNPFTMGLSLTTPSMNLFGSGSVGTHFFVSGLDSNQFSSNYQDDVESESKSSWAAGFGAAYKLEKFKFHFSAEWFDGIDKYYVMDTQPYQSQSSGNLETNDLTKQTKSIINYGFGIDYFVADSLIISASFISDYSAKSNEVQSDQPQTLGMNLFHFSTGSTFKVLNSLLTLGLVYTFGSQTIQEKIDLIQNGNSQISNNAELNFTQIKVIIGLEL